MNLYIVRGKVRPLCLDVVEVPTSEKVTYLNIVFTVNLLKVKKR